ncbi:MFS transporter-like protein [Dothidotthia symphoricarpi CBS 119687]|uniref:MFS transporter-like protein n=1 Tax=Dothidotthia symphoricarpi CBS 119687 TaxID=1392245 RepID=A0A6A6AT24_9PLEO|nr:MFS transporter-like protein [Dothidotthia symphoricarpi CBS 119687]KAF2134125.1 MFS transporter-like protein [Dothidotthia symphoricarpi CBS 119687]
MGLGILEDHKLKHVPGTAQVLQSDKRREVEQNVARNANLKYDKTGKILLVPQPSDDPNDPLNWPIRKRDSIIALLSLLSVIASTLSPLLAANTVSLAIFFRRSLTDMALCTGYHLLGVGISGFLIVPSARIWGKRHVYIFGTLIIVISSIWGGATGKNYASFLWARIFQGVGLAPFEALVNASVGDMYHVHERGVRMAVSNFCVFGGAFFTPVVVGVISKNVGYEWTFYLVAIFAGAMLPLIVLFCPETTYTRDSKFDIDSMGNLLVVQGAEMNVLGPASVAPSTNAGESEPHGDKTAILHTTTQHHTPPPPKTSFTQSLALFSGRKTQARYLPLLLRPISLFLHPGILWSCLIQGTLIGFTVLIGVVLAAIMLGPPLWFGEVETGYMYTGAFIGALLGFALTGLLADWSARVLTRWNNGVYEPEFRMLLVVPQLLLGGVGLYGFGWTSGDAGRYGWFLPDFFFGVVVVGMVCGAVGSALYVVDAFRDISVEAFTCLLVFKNFFSFALTFKGFDWMVEARSIRNVFIAVGSAQVGICLLTVPMYIFGKRNRSFFHRHNVFFKATDAVAEKLTFW